MIPQAAAVHRLRRSVSADWFDEDGFLADSACWTPGLAEDIARLEGKSDLSAKHWEIVHLVRER